MHSSLLSLNHLAHPAVSRRLDHAQLHPESPVAIKRNLELDQLDKELFPSLTTGVRWWPFLCLAFDCSTEAKYQGVFATTRRLKKSLDTSSRIGPSTKASFRPYRSMAKNIEQDPSCNSLYRYIKGRRFDGNASFFVNYEHDEKWKKYFLDANGKPAKAYLRAYLLTAKLKLGQPAVLDVVSTILKNEPSKFNSILWRGSFSFSFLRCLFGTFDRQVDEPISYTQYVMEWRDALLDILKNPPRELPKGIQHSSYSHLLNRIENANSPPPLAEQTKYFRREDRPVLAAMRIPLFHNLYFKSIPSQLER